MRKGSGRALLWVTGCFCCGACKQDPAPAASALATPSPSASELGAGPERTVVEPWYAGSWSGNYEAALHRLETKYGGVRAWTQDDGSVATGKGSLNLSIDQEGRVSGEAEGPLGPLSVQGRAEDDGLRLMLAPLDGGGPSTFRGVLIALREQDHLTGTLQASSGDSLRARRAKVELRRAASAP